MKLNLKEIIATVAPALATALGGPLAGMATRAIATELLDDPNADLVSIEHAIDVATGPDLLKLKELDVRFKADMAQAQVDLEEIAAKDRNSARDRQVQMKDWTPSVLGLAIIVGFFGVLAWIFQFGLPETGAEVLLIMVGALGAMTSQVGNYFFGSSTGSKDKDTIIADLKGGAAS
jgi:hypothetical protein